MSDEIGFKDGDCREVFRPMNCGVRLIKRADALLSSPRGQDKKSTRQNEREIGNTVKNWIEELAQRKRLTHLEEVSTVTR